LAQSLIAIAIWLAVKTIPAARRQGTHKVKTRAEVEGSSKSSYKQKVQEVEGRKGNLRNPFFQARQENCFGSCFTGEHDFVSNCK